MLVCAYFSQERADEVHDRGVEELGVGVDVRRDVAVADGGYCGHSPVDGHLSCHILKYANTMSCHLLIYQYIVIAVIITASGAITTLSNRWREGGGAYHFILSNRQGRMSCYM